MKTRKIAAGAAAVLASGVLTLAAVPTAHADDAPTAARDAAAAPTTLDTLSRFFARDGVTAMKSAAPHIEGATVTVNTLNPGFVAGDRGAAVALPDFAATKAVSADGRTASVWTVRSGATWKVVNIATGSDETDYVAQGGAQPGSTVFREPQIDAWYVLRAGRVLPLDPDAVKAVGRGGTTLAGYQQLVHRRYGDKLPGSAYDRAGMGGGYDTQAGAQPGAQPDTRAGAQAPAVAGGAPAAQEPRNAAAGEHTGSGASIGAVGAGLALITALAFAVRRRTTRRS
ncbi:hypothetical protein QMK19_32910 [Streptomyces sp. H10-C2]|uniref:hypothetical protein n=1 Tax=unclassified Streptomyces TaxID=2593676 RepID=UPI0024BB19E7|nr:MULTISPECIES: hypothetical protein [unclassified Streptomyces]MDJ0345429.1 hypothetical protein [Streptomyces sp. PH10-H1]MDJ0374307.1 hypothetical protein [Streptomyces sp. H10-C2]